MAGWLAAGWRCRGWEYIGAEEELGDLREVETDNVSGSW